MNILSFDDGTSVDLDTAKGQYDYVCRFLVENGADSGVFAAITNLFRATT